MSMDRESTADEVAVMAFDVGGANIKSATNTGVARSVPFEMWKYPDRLAGVLREMLIGLPNETLVVATMTGELADCFADKQEGVCHIVAAFAEAVGERSLQIYLTNGEFVSAAAARQEYALAAASNWHALASYVAQHESWQNCLLIDIGSTTCDVIPCLDGRVVSTGQTDLERLLAGELIYMGVERTSIVSLVDGLPYREQTCPVAREFFATTQDVFLILGGLAECPESTDTADGRPATKEFAIARLGRCLCADADSWTEHDATVAARYVAERVGALLGKAVGSVLAKHASLRQAPVVIAGHGDFALKLLMERPFAEDQVALLRKSIGPEASRAAPAYALAKLAERLVFK